VLVLVLVLGTLFRQTANFTNASRDRSGKDEFQIEYEYEYEYEYDHLRPVEAAVLSP
jgi:hypothetical protein